MPSDSASLRSSSSAIGDDEGDLRALRERDEAAFLKLVNQHHASLVRLARSYVKSRAVAEEVAQEAWTVVLENLDRFEGRSTIKTWLFGILVNVARARARNEGRSIPMSTLGDPADEGPTVSPDRFLPEGHRWAGGWASAPVAFPAYDPAEAAEVRRVISEAVEGLGTAQREVFILRDVEGLTGAEVCNILGVADTHQRVLLHRARAKIRAKLEGYYTEGGQPHE